ncbi:MAG TPA: hypothetical protein VM580_31435 [Labilithrix sp.]|nr:hypothetical protein [Labilithrix sp.]
MRFALAITPACRVLFAVLGMPGKSSYAEVDAERGTLHVKAGIWFEETFSLGEVSEVVPSSWPWYGGLGVKLGPDNSVGVVGSGKGVVAVRFSRPQTMHVLLTVHRSELRLSLESPDAFARAVREACASTHRGRDAHPPH